MIFGLLSICSLSFAQTDTIPGKLRYSPRLLSTVYEIGDKDVHPNEVTLHLEKTSPKAYYEFKRGRALDLQSTIWSTVGSLGLIVGLYARENNVRAIGYGVGAIGFGVGLSTYIGSQTRIERAVNIYNREYGY